MDNIEIARQSFLTCTSLFSILPREEIWIMSQSNNSETRCWVAKALSMDIERMDACEILCFLSKDSDALVRVEAVDSLSNYVQHDAYQCLLSAAYDPDELVRAYAAYGIACISSRVSFSDAHFFLHEMLARENCDRARVGILEALYIIGEDDYLLDMLRTFKSDDHLVRCSVIHALCEIANCTNYTVLSPFVENIDLERESPAVKSAIEQLLGVLTDLADER